MQIHLTDVLSWDGKIMEWTIPLEMEEVVSALGIFPIREKSPCRLTAENLGENQVRLLGTAGITVVIPCDRCLEDVETELSLHIEKEVKVLSGEENGTEEPEETEILLGSDLDVDDLVRSEILMNWPMKTLCREDCKGICKKCGKNLNLDSCDCDTAELDPRMAAIRDVFNRKGCPNG